MGLESDSIWFNHGFDSLSGPVDNVNFRPHLLENFREFVIGKLTGADGKNKQQFDVVIFESDKVKNVHEIKTLIRQSTLDMNTSSIDEADKKEVLPKYCILHRK